MNFRVLGKHVNGYFFDIEVSAPTGLAAFGAAAREMQEAGEDEDAEFFVAIPVGTVYELPGEGVVTLETVLDPDQAFVFGLAGEPEQGCVQEVDCTSDALKFNSALEVAPAAVAGQLQSFTDQQIQDVAMALGKEKVFAAAREMLHVFVPEQDVVFAMEQLQLGYARVVEQRKAG